jgi:hypothetical protein
MSARVSTPVPRVGEAVAAAAARLRRVWGEGLEEAEDELLCLWWFCLVCPVRFCLRGASDLGL